MINLNEILAKKDIIVKLASDFGFEELRVLKREPEEQLQLVAKNKQGIKQYSVAFEAMLVDHIDVNIRLIQEENLKVQYRDDILDACASIDDTTAIEKLFGKSLTEISFENAPIDQESIFNREQDKLLAQRVLDKQKGIVTPKPSAGFFAEQTEKTDATITKKKRGYDL